jgi:uncharacterized membrane protein
MHRPPEVRAEASASATPQKAVRGFVVRLTVWESRGVCIQMLVGDFLHFTYPRFAVSFAVFAIPGAVFWPYFAGIALLAIGLPIVIKNELHESRGIDKLMPFGRLFFAIPLAVFAAEHFTATRFIALLIPAWIPAHVFFVYLVGVALVAAALSIIVKKNAQLAATLLGIMIFLFVVLLHIPRVMANPRDRIAWAVALRDLSFSGGAFALAGAQSQAARPDKGTPPLVTIARFFVAVPALFFGVEHFLHPDFAPGVPLQKLTPAWIPLGLFWSYLTGAVLLAAGACILVNKKARAAATCLGITILLIVLVIYLPIELSIPADIGNGLNYFADTLLFCGAVFVLADALPKEAPSHA